MYGIATMLRGHACSKSYAGYLPSINNAAREHARWRVVVRGRERVRAGERCATARSEAGGTAGEEYVRAGE